MLLGRMNKKTGYAFAKRKSSIFLKSGYLKIVLSIVTVLLFGCVLFWCRRTKSDSDEGSKRPDIILISIDSLRSDHLGCYGYQKPTSPNIDNLALEGVVCEKGVSTTSWTLPAHAALFTGLYDSAHGLVDNGLRLGKRHVTLAEVLQEAGYTTAGFFGGPYLHPTFGLDQGFQSYQSCMTESLDDEDDIGIRIESRKYISVSHADITGPRMLEKFGSWLKTIREEPVFAFLHMWDVHYDYIPDDKYVKIFDPDYTGDIDSRNFMPNKAINRDMDKRDLEHIIALYDGEIRFTDDIIGGILKELDRHGRLDNALVVIVADHGEEFFEHGYKGHNRSLFDEVIMVPVIFRWPGHLPAATRVTGQVRMIDIMPTILGLTGITSNARMQGEDLSRVLRGEETSERTALCELLSGKRQYRMLRTNREKILHDGKTGKWVYYDLLKDPGEQKQLKDKAGPSVQRYQELIETVHISTALQERIIGDEDQRVKIDDAMKERLRSLGYIGNE